MKKQAFILYLLLYILATSTFAQGTSIQTWATIGDKFLIASLPKTGAHNYHKLKIEILGGNFHNNNLGTRTYSISSRNGNGTENLVIMNQEQSGGGIGNYNLKVYETNANYDFVIESTSTYMSIFVQVWLTYTTGNEITPITAQEIKKYNVGSSQDVTSQVKKNIIYTTDYSGNIGIGTESPQAKLDVRGKIIADEVQIKVNTGADFVFQPDYNLKPLSEVEQFVKTNKHLPEIPSEKQMIEEGLNVNEMQIKLLQKIEELTLYVIEQDKKIEKLQEQINSK
ncbi:hypothetical protein [Dysgonomonas sp. ZJ709]|uniref:hypothetical protein n=1 Tax=Dysgonomonas sp. ZJ709 TaxID=2709797 RepID=UPI00210784A3|nr:hypothetical protein [Dysgonomonas sp. ZJ709]